MTSCVQCVTCRHYRPGMTCDAFPIGIPSVILTGERDHRQPFPGDKGIRWEPAEGVDPDILEEGDE